MFIDGVETTFPEVVGHARVDLRFGADAAGELYLISKANGKIWKVVGARDELASSPNVHPDLARNVIAHYDFDHPVVEAPEYKADQGISGTPIELINGGVDMRVADEAYPSAGQALQTQQVSPTVRSNDDWKAGVYDANGLSSLRALGGTEEISVMGWFKPTGEHPRPNSNTDNPNDTFGDISLAGVLSGNSDGHMVRALLEVLNVNGEQRLVALGRRVDGGASWIYAARTPWKEILRQNEWTHLAATFDFAAGEMKLFVNGEEIEGEYTNAKNPCGSGPTSAAPPAGIKIGGSFPQNTREANPFVGRMDDLMFPSSAVTPQQVAAQYEHFGVETTPTVTVDPLGIDRTVVVNEHAHGHGVRLTAPDGTRLPSEPVTFTLSAGTFSDGSAQAIVLTNAGGIAIAPRLTSSAPGSVVLTASAAGVTAQVATIEFVEASADTGTIEVSAEPVSGRWVLTVTVTAGSSGADIVRIKTRYGSRILTNLSGGETVQHQFKTFVAKLPAGSVTAEFSTTDGTLGLVEAPYAAAQ